MKVIQQAKIRAENLFNTINDHLQLHLYHNDMIMSCEFIVQLKNGNQAKSSKYQPKFAYWDFLADEVIEYSLKPSEKKKKLFTVPK